MDAAQLGVAAALDDTVARLRVRGLAKRFGRHIVLDDVDLDVHRGELVALVGENGAGKSTLVQCVAGTLTPDRGSVTLTGGGEAAVVWQDLALCENLDAIANLFLGREPGRFWLSDSSMDRRAHELLDRLGITIDDLRRPVSALSGGQRQSLAIARALVEGPDLLVLDEPTASLGVLETRTVERLLRDLRGSGCALLLISHRLDQVFGLADRVVVMRHGRIVADRPTTELHPDDVVSLMAGLDVETTARKQMERLRSLVDQLAEVEPSASIPLIVSALSTAVGAHQICIHLAGSGTTARPVLRRRAAVGIRPPLLAVNAEVPIGPAGGMVGLAAERGEVVVTDDVRRHPAWADTRTAAVAAGVRSGWAMPIVGVDGVVGVISVYADVVGRPQPAVLELAAMYTSLAVAAIERERLLGEVTRRNQILESLRGMLDTLTGPMPADDGLVPALAALCRALGASAVVVAATTGAADGVVVHLATDGHGRRPADVAEAESLAAVADRLAGRAAAGGGRARVVPLTAAAADRTDPLAGGVPGPAQTALVAWWPDDADIGDDAHDLLADAGRSLSIAIEREDVAAARVEAESLRRAQQAQREFLSRLSHELRTPLTAIHGYASTLRQPDVEWDAASQTRFLGVIEGESARMGRLVADLLDSSTIESGGLRIDPDWCDLELTVGAAAGCVTGAGVGVVTEIAPEAKRIWADHDRLEQVLVNLLENAVRHGRADRPVRVAAGAGAAPDTIAITVTDDGPGFDAELAARAFDPYARGATAVQGAGLGLAVCRGIVEAHGGTITIATGAVGGEVVVVLPADPPAGTGRER